MQPHRGREMHVGAYFAALLARVTPTRGSIWGFRLIALASLEHFPHVWAAVRDALAEAGRDAGDRTRALWYVVDGLLTDAPAVYGSYVARELPDLCRKLLPLHEPWCLDLVERWVLVLPVNSQIGAVAREAAAEHAQAQLDEELTAAAQRLGRDDLGDEPATPEDLHELQEVSERILAAVQRRRKSAATTRVKLESVKLEPGLVKEERVALTKVAEALRDVGNTKDTALDADEDYVPGYVAGAKMGRLRREGTEDTAAAAEGGPGSAGQKAAATGAKREKRVRPRE